MDTKRTLKEMVYWIEYEDRAKKLTLHLVHRRSHYDLRDPIEGLAYTLLAKDLLHALGVACIGELRVVP